MKVIERDLGIVLPEDYREFLLWFGNDHDGVLVGSDCFVNDVVKNTEALPELMADNDIADLLPPRFVCPFMHQGYIATWFAVPTDSGDPRGYAFHEGQREKGVQGGETIMELFLRDIIAMAEYIKKKT